MPSISIQLNDHRSAFAPREKISGKVTWQLESPPQSAELRLMWSTSGRGIGDYGTAETVPFPNPQMAETRSFVLTAPGGPYSFSGKLITLAWTIEVTLQPGNLSNGVEITVAPGGKVVELPRA